MNKLLKTVAFTFVITLLFQHNTAHALPDSFAPIIEKVRPGVVSIRAARTIKQESNGGEPNFNVPPGSPFEEFFRRFNEPFQNNEPPKEQKSVQLGSGFFIGKEGYVVTNNHVIDNTENIEVITESGISYPAKLIGVDPRTDIALLKVDAKKLTPLEWGDSDKLRVGDWVLAIGNPHGLSSSVSLGIVSAKGRNIHAGSYDDFIQTDAAINQGNSGGPLVSADGLIVGVNTLIFSPSGGSIGIGFAIPTSLVRDVVEQLKKYGETRRGWLGVELGVLSDEIASALKVPDNKGALVSNVTLKSPASKAGLKAGDVILSFDNNRIDSSGSLPIIVARAGVGHTAKLTIWRNGKRVRFTVKLGHLEKNIALAQAKTNNNKTKQKKEKTNNNKTLGIDLSDFKQEERKLLPYKNKQEGILIDYVDVNGVAYKAGLRPGHIITQMNNIPILNVASFNSMLAKEKKSGSKTVAIRYFNGRTFQYTGLKIN